MDKYSFILAVLQLIFRLLDKDSDGVPDFLEGEQPEKEPADDGSTT